MRKIVFETDTDEKSSVSCDLDGKLESVETTDKEDQALKMIYSALEAIGVSSDEIHLERRTDKYLTLVVFQIYDFCRILMGPRSKWFTITLSPKDRKAFADDPRFSDQKNKNQIHWKVKIKSTDEMAAYSDFIQKSYLWAFEQNERYPIG